MYVKRMHYALEVTLKWNKKIYSKMLSKYKWQLSLQDFKFEKVPLYHCLSLH